MQNTANILLIQFFRNLAIGLGFAFCSPAFAQTHSPYAIEVQSCAEKVNFDPDGFIGTESADVSKIATAFVKCLKTTSNPKEAEIQMWIGFGYMFDATDTEHNNARNAFCAAAEAGYVLGQEKCSTFSNSKVLKYKWALAAALSGSHAAQMAVSVNSWSGAAPSDELEYNNYLVQYLSCHPAMFRDICRMARDSVTNAECRTAMQEVAVKQLADLQLCHAQLKSAFQGRETSATLSKWEQQAQKRLAETLVEIREQVRRYPSLVNLLTITP
jgi:hypothetical protein